MIFLPPSLQASIIAQEEQKTGQLGAGTYTAYMKGMGGIAVSVGVLLLIAAGQVGRGEREGGVWTRLSVST